MDERGLVIEISRYRLGYERKMCAAKNDGLWMEAVEVVAHGGFKDLSFEDSLFDDRHEEWSGFGDGVVIAPFLELFFIPFAGDGGVGPDDEDLGIFVFDLLL